MFKKLLLLGSVLTGLVTGSSGCAGQTCYVMTIPTTTQMRYEYKELLDKYHKEGTINQETYDKLLKAFDEEINKNK